MQDLTFFYILVSVCIIFFVAVIAIVAYHVIQTLKKIQEFLDHSNNIVKDVRTAKDTLEIGMLSNIVKALRLFTQRR